LTKRTDDKENKRLTPSGSGLLHPLNKGENTA